MEALEDIKKSIDELLLMTDIEFSSDDEFEDSGTIDVKE
jgi:hypothetical protein